MIIFKTVSIENFMSIGESEVDLSTGGFTLISAINNRVADSSQSNGAGKSSIAEAITWCITGETIRGHKEVVNRYTNGNCSVEVSFEFKGSNWLVKRSMTRDKEKSLVIVKDGQELKAKGYRDSQEVFVRELPELTFKFINSVIILGQGLPGRFTNNSPAGRKAVLEELTNADFMITQIKENIKSRQEILSIDLRKTEDMKLKSEAFIDLENKALASDRQKLEILLTRDTGAIEREVSEFEKELTVLERDMISISDNLPLVKASLAKAKADEVEFTNKNTEIANRVKEALAEKKALIVKEISSKKEEEVAVITERIKKGEKLIDETRERISHNEALISGGTCKLCGQRLKSVSDEALRVAKEGLDIDNSNLRKYKELYQSLQNELSSIRARFSEEEKLRIEEEQTKCNQELETLRASYKIEIVKYKEVIDKAEFELEKLEEDKNKLSSRITELKIDIKAKRGELSNHLERIKTLEDSINLHLGCIKDETSDLEKLTSKIEDLQNRLSTVKQMETFASRDFRGILLEGVISRMNTIIGNYAELVYGNRLTNFYLDGNAIQVEFDGKEYESLSGGEQQKINVILQLSLRDLIVELTGVTGSMLFLDEVFDGLDSVGCEKMIELFQAIETSIFVVTHHKELNIPYDYILTVIKESNGVAHIQRGE